MSLNIERNKPVLYRLIISVLLTVILFPLLDFSYSPGLDSSYKWALNYLFRYNPGFFSEMFYPYGVLGFLKHPGVTGLNPAFSLAFFFIVNFSLSYMLMWHIRNKRNVGVQITGIVFIALLLYLSRIDISIVILVLVLIWAFEKEGRKKFLIPVLIFSALVVFIKVSIAVNVFGMLFFYAISLIARKKYLKVLLYSFTGFILLLFVMGALFTGDPAYAFHYLNNIVKMTLSYGGALSVYVENSRVLLGIGMLSLASLIFIHRKTEVLLIFIIMLVPLYGFWKHGIIRQDIMHYQLWFLFISCFFIIIPFISDKIRSSYIIFAGIAALVFIMNKDITVNSSSHKLKTKSPKAFISAVFTYNNNIEKAKIESERRLIALRLPDHIISEIQQKTIDIYPWNLSYIPANNLNYHPRVSLQSGAYAEWLDHKSAESLRNSPPEYIWFHFNYDRYGNPFGNYDNRFLPNDEPETILRLFNDYHVVVREFEGLLLKRNEKLSEPIIREAELKKADFENWIDVPNSEDGEILRLKLNVEQSLKYKIRSLIYKPLIFYMDYKFEDGRISRYRFVTENAESGLWINPYPDLEQSDFKKVKQLRFLSYPEELKSRIEYRWQFISLNKNSVILNDNAFDHQMVLDSVFGKYGYLESGEKGIKNSHKIKPGGYSHGFNFVTEDTIRLIRAGVWSHQKNNENSMLVLSVRQNNENILYLAPSLKPEIITDEWHYIPVSHAFNEAILPGATIKCYVWNSGSSPVWIDELRLEVKSQ